MRLTTTEQGNRGGARPTFTYRDEIALTRHVLDVLERRLAGRHERRVLRTVPTDHCRLGVLGPRDPDVEQPEPQEPSSEPSANGPSSSRDAGAVTEPPGEDSRVSGWSAGGTRDRKDNDGSGEELEDGESFAEAEQVASERRGSNQDPTRRPPSSLGFEIMAEPEDGAIELRVSGSFAVYTQRFPTLEEQREQRGEAAGDPTGGPTGEPGATGTNTRDRVSLLDAYTRRVVEIPPVTLRLDPARRVPRLNDGGAVQRALDAVLDGAVTEPDFRREITGYATLPVPALDSEESYEAHLRSIATGELIRPPLRASLDVRVNLDQDGGFRIRCYLRNDTPRNPERRTDDQRHVLADVRLEGELVRGTLRPVELLPVAEDYQYDRRVWAVGHSASAVVDRKCSGDRTGDRTGDRIRTRTLARYEQPRRTTKEEPAARFEELATDPFGTLESIRQAMVAYSDDWQERLIDGNEDGLTPRELVECEKDLAAFRDEQARFAEGMAALAADERLLDAFVGMNEVFQRTSAGRSQGRGYDRWRLFQIAFIVTQLPSLAIREGITGGSWPEEVGRSWDDALSWGDVLWFPTGGGKTEAYLGLISCSALYDRLRGKRFGITAWLRFPLRMLSVQQLQRAATVVWETEQQRRSMLGDESDGSAPISLGYFVGGTSTPNMIRTDNQGRWSYGRLEQDASLREKLLLVSDCPACPGLGRGSGIGTVEVVVDREAHRIRHVCSRCETKLPVYVSDEEVYRFLPTVLVGTVDKMASVAWNPKFSMLWGGVRWRCPEHPEHGYGMGDFCFVYGCSTNPRSGRSYAKKRPHVSLYDPAPSFHIQDELHLLQQELGAFAGHYETLVRSCEMAAGSGLPPKTVAATATIEGFEHQVRQVYGVPNARRFPERGYDLLESFYATVDKDPEDEGGRPKTGRIYVAFRPPNMHAADAASLCARLIHEEILRLHQNPYEAAALLPNARTEEEVKALLRYYETTLTYVGSKTRGLRVRQSLERDAARLGPAGGRELATEFLSGDSSLADIADAVRRVESPPAWEEEGHLDATVATSVISHGVDVERFNLMVMDGIPEETADYIQASSRSGRRHVGLIVAVLASYSLRASSIYHRFNEYHAHLDRMVSPVPVNRFAKYAAERTAPGILLGLLYGRYGALAKTDKFKQRNVAIQLLSPSEPTQLPFQVRSEDLLHDVESAYALAEDVYPEGLELAMKAVVREHTDRIIYRVRASRKQKIADAVDPAPMTSLRDVDAGVGFHPAPDADWQELEHFRRS